MGLFWYFLMALGFLIMVMLAVPDDDPAPPPKPPAIELGTAPAPDRSP
jgi:hypothetical protein